MTEILVCKTTFVYADGVVAKGELVHKGHPVTKGREMFFEPMTVKYALEESESHEEHEHFVEEAAEHVDEAAHHAEEAQAHDEDAAELLDELPAAPKRRTSRKRS